MHRSVGVTVAALLGLILGWSGSDAGRLLAGQAGRGQTAKPAAAAPAGGPQFQVDPLWPKPLPNHWILGSVTGVAVDAQDHVWIVHRGAASLTVGTEMGTGTTPPTAEYCCSAAPPVLEFDAAGNLVSHWGGPGEGYNWPTTPGGIAVDPKGNGLDRGGRMA